MWVSFPAVLTGGLVRVIVAAQHGGYVQFGSEGEHFRPGAVPDFSHQVGY
jgi:hypothetical protein